MVLGNASKLYGFVGILAGITALPLGCGSSEFEGCAASRTCPPSKGGEAGGGASSTGGTGNGGEAGGGPETGGSSGSGAGRSGAAGSDDGGAGSGSGADGGHGGNGDDTEAPTVLNFTPGDGDGDVERDVVVTAELSEPIDESTVTQMSVTLEGPDGEVSGTVSVDENVISFVADRPLHLLGTYTFTLVDTVADLAGNTLAQNVSAEFQVRDGRWSELTFPFGRTVSRTVTQAQRNALGDVALAMDVLPDGDSVYGSTYRAADNRWSSAALLDGASGFTWGAAIDEAQRAVVTWGFTGDYGWSRLTSQGSWVNAGALGYTASVTVTPAGMATALVYDGGSNSYITQTLNLSNGAVDPVVPTGISGPFAGPFLVASLERVALVWARGATNGQELVVAWKGASDWSTPEPLAATVDIRTLVVDADEQGNIMLVWNDVNEVWSRTYQRGTDEWTRTQFVAATTTEAIIHPLDVTRGNAILAVDSRDTTEGTWAAIYEAGTGWIDSSIVSLDDPPDGQDIAVSIDAAGNALAVWQSELRFQRYVAGVGWQTPSSLQARVDPVYVWSAAAPDGSVLVVANDLEDSPSVYPMAIRFE